MKNKLTKLPDGAEQLPNYNVYVLDNTTYCAGCGIKISRPNPNERGTIVHDAQNCKNIKLL